MGSTGFSAQEKALVLRGPYLGQKPPGNAPVLFAPGVISTGEDEYAFEVSPSGNEMVFVRAGRIMLAEKNADGTWSGPFVAPFSGKDIDGECCFSPDGTSIFFTSRRPFPGSKKASNVWVSKKAGGVWGEAAPFRHLSHPEEIHALSVASDGDIYDSGLIRFKCENGKYSPAEGLVPPIAGWSPFVAPDERYIIFSRKAQGRNDRDLFITFKKKDATWTPPLSLGGDINSPKIEGNSFVTADGKYLFFSRQFDIYWVQADFIERAKPSE